MSKPKYNPRQHIPAMDAAKRLGHGRRWLFNRIRDGQLEGFKHSQNDVTVSLESIVAYEDRTRISPAPEPVRSEPVEGAPAA